MKVIIVIAKGFTSEKSHRYRVPDFAHGRHPIQVEKVRETETTCPSSWSSEVCTSISISQSPETSLSQSFNSSSYSISTSTSSPGQQKFGREDRRRRGGKIRVMVEYTYSGMYENKSQ